MDPIAESFVKPAQALIRSINDRNVSTHAGGNQRRVVANDAATEHCNPPGSDAGHAAEKHAGSTFRLLQVGCAGLDCHAAGDFAHWREQRQATVDIRNGLVGNRRHSGGKQQFCLLAVGSQVQVGEKNLSSPQPPTLVRLRLFDLDEEICQGKYLVRRLGDRRARATVFVVWTTNAGAGVGLDQDAMPSGDQFAGAGGRQADAIFVILDFLGNTD